MGKSQKATCESKALEGLFPPHWVHKLDTVQFLCPLQGLHPHGWLLPGWTAKIRAAFWSWKREQEEEGHRQTQLALTLHTPIPAGRSCNGILHLSATSHTDGPWELAASAFPSLWEGETGQACRHRELWQLHLGLGASLGVPKEIIQV